MKAFPKMALISSLVLSVMSAGVVSSVANAKANFRIMVCYSNPNLSTGLSMSGSTFGTIQNNGGLRSFNSQAGVWCNSVAYHVATDPNEGNYLNWPLGGQENMLITLTTPTFSYKTARITGTVTIKQSCTVPITVPMKVIALSRGYTEFAPANASGVITIQVRTVTNGVSCTPVL